MGTYPPAWPVLNGGETAQNGRDIRGRFTVGATPGPGRPRNPFSRKQAALRRAALAEVHATDVRALVRVLLTRALAGDLKAADILFAWVIGPPPVPVHPDRLDADEAELQRQTPTALERLLVGLDRESRGVPRDAAGEDEGEPDAEHQDPRVGWQLFADQFLEAGPAWAAPVDLVLLRYAGWCAGSGRRLLPESEVLQDLTARGAVMLGLNGDQRVQGFRVLD
jgi:hypothetical protein